MQLRYLSSSGYIADDCNAKKDGIHQHEQMRFYAAG